MCKHVLNAQVSIRSPCCRKWFDCAECHAEQEDHPLLQSFDMTFICKKCKKAFRKNTKEWEDRWVEAILIPNETLVAVAHGSSDEYCPNCDNHFVIDAVTPKAALKVESEDTRVDARMIKDERVKQSNQQSIFDLKGGTERLG
ncbi:hypothetical protein FOPE_07076 [Fonsecaea pedrosoi]|nr:hypothetical protein FOPE_07076 [Fonsecaea pedrosoi]